MKCLFWFTNCFKANAVQTMLSYPNICMANYLTVMLEPS